MRKEHIPSEGAPEMNQEGFVNPWNKKSAASLHGDLCADARINPTVTALYHQYQDDCNAFLPQFFYEPGVAFLPDDRKYYVYAWHTNTTPKKYFYIGKGTRDRYKHILKELALYREEKTASAHARAKRMAYLQDTFGISPEILLDGLSEYEALIYEQATKVDMCRKGEVLLNVEGIDEEHLPSEWKRRIAVTVPFIQEDPFFSRYCGYTDKVVFDSFTLDDLKKIYLYPFGDGREDQAEAEMHIIRSWLESVGGKEYTSGTAKGVHTVIVFKCITEERYRAFRECGKKICSSMAVAAMIKRSIG